MKRPCLIVVLGLTIFGLSRAARAAYIFNDAQGRRLTIVGTRVMMGRASTVWHGKRGGVFCAFHEGRRWYLTADAKGDVFVTVNKQSALRWDFTETKPDKSKTTPTYRPHLIPQAASSISTRGIDDTYRALIVLTGKIVRDANGTMIQHVSLVRLSPPGPTLPDSTPPTTFTIRGSDSQFTTGDAEESNENDIEGLKGDRLLCLARNGD